MDWDAFFTLHRDLPREGPGGPEDVHWAVGLAGLSGAVRICDAGCGPGADSETLAEALPEAAIDALDQHPPFVAATAARCARFGPRVSARAAPMEALSGPYDLIWCAGAIYFLGVSEALGAWRPALRAGGKVAFSEPVLLGGEEPQAVRDFWADYPAITDAEGISARVAAAGYRVLGTREVIGAPWAAYYAAQEARVAALRRAGVPKRIERVLSSAEAEIAGWRAAPERIAYLLVLAEPA